MQISLNNATVRLPDILLVGAAKSGTTSIAHQFTRHPGIFLPMAKKEPHFFSFNAQQPPYRDAAFVKTLVWRPQDYAALYAPAPPQALIADCSTSYLYRHGTAIPHLQGTYGEKAGQLALSAILRDPVERAYSHWLYLVRNGHEDLPFEQAVDPAVVERRKWDRWGFDYLGYGLYAEAVERFQAAFPNFKVYLLEDLKDLQATFDDICKRAGAATCAVEQVQSNPGGVPKNRGLVRTIRRNPLVRSLSHLLPAGLRNKARAQRDRVLKKALDRPAMPQVAREMLNAYYKADVDRLSRAIGRDLGHWCAR
ncbi:MAG: hypothetical protein KBH07_01445 [Flavobacteriales bacterium]|nr:hypothetical protein [Flavobacteriales bacterium]MBP9079014.1 hypothetical protein [Flavobacteriales bacterium]